MQMASSRLGQNSQPNVTGYHSNKTQLRTACSLRNACSICLVVPLSAPNIFLQLELIVGCCVLRQAAGITVTSVPVSFLSLFFPAVDHLDSR